jgi:glycosyltransferase involved in cell wall biosynthesis
MKDQVLLHYRIDWQEDGVLWSIEPILPSDEPRKLRSYHFQDATVVEFDIITPARQLSTLSLVVDALRLGTWAVLTIELSSADGTLLLSTTRELAGMPESNVLQVLDFGHFNFQPGGKYRVRLRLDGDDENDISVPGLLISPGTGRYELRRHLEGLIASRVFARQQLDKSLRDAPAAILIVPDLDASRSKSILLSVHEAFPEVAFYVLDFDAASNHLTKLRMTDVVVFANVFAPRSGNNLGFDELCFYLHRHSVCTVFFDTDALPRSTAAAFTWSRSDGALNGDRQQHARRCHFTVTGAPDFALLSSRTNRQPVLPAFTLGTPVAPAVLRQLVDVIRAPANPTVAIVVSPSIGLASIERVLAGIAKQSYAGRIVAVLCDGGSCTGFAEEVQKYWRQLSNDGISNREAITIVPWKTTDSDVSVLAGLSVTDAAILISIDAFSLINHDFVAAHVFEHWWDDVGVVVSRSNIESGHPDPHVLSGKLERDPSFLEKEGLLEGVSPADSPIDYANGSFSIKRHIAVDLLSGEDYRPRVNNYSNGSWARLELAYRLYSRGVIVRATDHAFSVRTDPSAVLESAAQSAQNLATLLEKNTELALVARRWVADLPGVHPKPPVRKRRLRILSYRWHVPHQYELHKLPHDFVMINSYGPQMTASWSFGERPLRANAQLVSGEQIDLREFDVALLHFDEHVLAPYLSNGHLPSGWGDAFNWLLETDRLPKIAICHGTVPFVGQYAADPNTKTWFTVHEVERKTLVARLAAAKARVVCNSYQAQIEWGFFDSQVIWQGFDPLEFPPTTLARDVLTPKPDELRPHYRGTREQTEVLARLGDGIRVETTAHAGAPIEIRGQNPFAVRQFRSYVDHIRQFKIFLNTTLRSPMPRTRGEAMITGVIPVSLRNHDVERFVENGVDGFYADCPGDLADFINDLLRDPERTSAMSRAARLKALDLFNHDRFLAAWTALLREVCN